MSCDVAGVAMLPMMIVAHMPYYNSCCILWHVINKSYSVKIFGILFLDY